MKYGLTVKDVGFARSLFKAGFITWADAMEFLKGIYMMKNVNYFGKSVTVPDYAKYIATDSNGEMWWYTDKPNDSFNRWLAVGKKCGCVGSNSNIKNWRRSLREC